MAILNFKSLLIFCGGMIVAENGDVNWKAFGVLVAILVPLISAVAVVGIFAGGMTNVPEDLRLIDDKLDSIIHSSDARFDRIERDLAVLKVKINK